MRGNEPILCCGEWNFWHIWGSPLKIDSFTLVIYPTSAPVKCRIIYCLFVRNKTKCFPGKCWATFTQNLQLRNSTLWSTGSLNHSIFFKDICLHHRVTLEFSIFTSMTAADGLPAFQYFLVAVSVFLVQRRCLLWYSVEEIHKRKRVFCIIFPSSVFYLFMHVCMSLIT